ncbi:MAG: InlB B-repeat-containing protein, partial [Treponema sp.]|nr:InlB B-repeat-containing protein [Treponema sp.]
MKNFFRIAALFFAFGLAAAFAGCSNAAGGGDNHAPTPTTTTYTVSFDANDGSQNPAKATQIFTAGTPQNLTPIADLGFKRDNFAFAGWALSSAASQAAYADKAEYTGNISITLYAVWTPIYTVTFDSKGGSEVVGQKVTSGQTATRPDDPAKEHFNFAGWCSDENCQTPFDFAAPITAPTTLYAKWSDLPVYVVTFDLNGGKYGASDSYTQNVETGSKAIRPASAPTKDDNVSADMTTKYAFDNWYADAGCGTLFDFDTTTISGPTTVYAKWSETKYCAVKISSGIEHGSVSSDAAEHIAAGTLVTLAASPSAGYKFGAYTVTDADSNPVTVTDGKFTMPASPVTVSASFIAIEYTITCGTPESGTLTADKAKATIGTTVTLTVSANDGYELEKLLVKDSGGADVSVTEIAAGASYTFTMPASPVTVTAVFIVEEIISHIPLTLEAIEAGANVTFTNKASGPVTYRVNEGDSQAIASGAEVVIPLPNVGDKVSFYGDNATYATSVKYSNIACDKDCYVYGNIMSLVDSANYENATTLKGSYTFYGLFKDNAHIKNKAGRDLLLPATTLAKMCYESMFSGCTGLASAPELPATTLAEWCYTSMFEGCASLVSAPELPATTLAECCYRSMFSGCAGL